MDIRIVEQAQTDDPAAGGITLEVELDLDDVTMLKEQALRAYEIEQALPAAARTAFGNAGEAAYVSNFIETRAVNDALEVRNIIPVAAPRVTTSAGLIEAKPFTCTVHVHPRPHIGLTSLEPVDLATHRIPKAGFSLKAAQAGEEGVEYLEDEKVLRMAMTDRLDSDLPESAMRALGEEYQGKFELELAARGSDPESFRATHQIDDEQYMIMLTRRALSDARWNYVLDAVFDGKGFSLGEDDVLAAFEKEFPGHSEQLFELYELRNELWKVAERASRKKALDWLLANALEK